MRIKQKILIFVLLSAVCPVYSGWLVEPETELAQTTKATQAPNVTPKTADQQESSEPSGPEVTLINLKKQDQAGILITWQNPTGLSDYTLRIYRAQEALDAEGKVTEEKLVTTVKPPQVSYLDKPSQSGKYFYAVTVVSAGKENKDLTPDVSYTTFGMSVAPAVVSTPQVVTPVLPVQVKGIDAQLKGADEVNLNWTFSTDTNVSYSVYRSKSQIQKPEDLKEKLKTVRGRFIDIILEPGDYYYAVTAQNSAGENKEIAVGMNSLANPVKIAPKPVEVAKPAVVTPVVTLPAVTVRTEIVMSKKQTVVQEPSKPVVVTKIVEKPEVAVDVEKADKPVPVKKAEPVLHEDTLLSIKRGDYYEARYQTAVTRLRTLISDPECPEEVRVEAELFIGKSYYHLGKYSDAIKMLVKARKHYPEEVDFWISRAADKL